MGPEIGSLLHAVCDDARHTAQTKEMISYINHLLDGWRILYQPGGYRQRDTERGSLSSREREIVDLIARGQSNKEIARSLRIGSATVKNHVHSILTKLQAKSRGEAAAALRSADLAGRSSDRVR